MCRAQTASGGKFIGLKSLTTTTWQQCPSEKYTLYPNKLETRVAKKTKRAVMNFLGLVKYWSQLEQVTPAARALYLGMDGQLADAFLGLVPALSQQTHKAPKQTSHSITTSHISIPYYTQYHHFINKATPNTSFVTSITKNEIKGGFLLWTNNH